MIIEALAPGQSSLTRTTATTPGAEKIKESRNAAEKNASTAESTQQSNTTNQVQPEELLQSIKALTDNGTYSVRFELHKETNEMVINLIDQESGETIRQIPPEEILGIHKMLTDLRGNLLETTS